MCQIQNIFIFNVQNSLRRNKRAPTLDSTLAMDASNSVIATSYHQVITSNW